MDIERFRPAPQAPARAELGLDPARRYLLFPADPARPEKRHDRALALAQACGVRLLTLGGIAPELVPIWVHAADAVKRALPTARVGGPHVAGTKSPEATKFLRDFLEHCLRGKNHATGKTGSPLDFVAFHAKGEPRFVEGHVRTGIGAQLRDIDRGFEVVAGYPELKDRPIIIGESDPDGCAACPSSVYPQNGYRNGTLYASYTAATFARKYLLAVGLLTYVVWRNWSPTSEAGDSLPGLKDVWEAHVIRGQPIHGDFLLRQAD